MQMAFKLDIPPRNHPNKLLGIHHPEYFTLILSRNYKTTLSIGQLIWYTQANYLEVIYGVRVAKMGGVQCDFVS